MGTNKTSGLSFFSRLGEREEEQRQPRQKLAW